MSIFFEIHITIADLSDSKTNDFVAICLQNEAKPILIKLAQGRFVQQPMFTKVVCLDNINEALDIANHYVQLLNKTFKVNRLKIEIPSKDVDLLPNDRQRYSSNYYEWHGKINYIEGDKLTQLCVQHKVHLSRNSLKNESDKRFITLREFGGQDVFQIRINKLIIDLEKSNWQLDKQQSEYCVYDDNALLDAGWLPQ